MVTNQPPRWGVICGAWGDVLCSLASFRERVSSGNIVHYGYDPSVATFLRQQDWVKEVVHVVPNNWDEYYYLSNTLWDSGGHLTDEMRTRLASYEFPEDRIVGTTFAWDDPRPRQYQGTLNLSAEAMEWAAKIVDAIPRPFFLVNPFSFNSTGKEDHWPHWYDFMHTLFGGSDNHFFLSGTGWSARDFGKYVNVHSLVDSAPSMMHVFALANLCDGTITTSSGLGHWGIAKNANTVIVCNKLSSRNDYYFCKVLEQDDPHSKVQVARVETSVKALFTRLHQNFGVGFNESLPYNLDNEFRVPKNFNYVFMPESRKFAHLVAPYLIGDGLDLGAGGNPIHGRSVSVDVSPNLGQLVGSADNLYWFKDEVFDYVYSSHLLEDFADWNTILKEWMRVIRPGGYLVVQIPDHRRYRAFVHAGQQDNNDHKHEGMVGELTATIASIGGWSVIMDKFAHPVDYNILFVAQKNLS